jgi:hypothetical protein
MFNNKDKVKFSELIEAQTGYKVLSLTDDIVEDITPFVKQAIVNYNAGPIWQGRVNEFGNHMEDVLRKTNSEKFTKPKKSNGKKQSTGYPDLKCTSNNTVVYDEVKVLKSGSDDGVMRSFYLSTFDKITSDAVHVVIGFEHIDKKLTGNYHIVDMSDKTLAVKIEFACGNKELYNK